AMMLLFADLKGLGSDKASEAMRSVSGYDLSQWIELWHAHLTEPVPKRAGAEPAGAPDALRALTEHGMPVDARDRARRTRAAELLLARGAPGPAVARLRGVLAGDASDPGVRARLGRALMADGKAEQGAPLFASPEGLSAAHAGWFALEGWY